MRTLVTVPSDQSNCAVFVLATIGCLHDRHSSPIARRPISDEVNDIPSPTRRSAQWSPDVCTTTDDIVSAVLPRVLATGPSSGLRGIGTSLAPAPPL